jgi:glucokinase
MEHALPGAFVGLDVGGTYLKAALLDAQGALVEKRRYPIRKDSAASILAQFAEAVRDLAGAEPVRTVRAIGIGLPGIVDRAARVRVAPNVPVLNGLAVGEEVRARTGVAAFAENDANVAALAEAYRGAGRGADNVLVVTLGTGVGGGVVLKRRLWTGTGGYAGEIGHIQVDQAGVRCGCGSWGCLETLVGVPSWERRGRAALEAGRSSTLATLAKLEPKTVVAEAEKGDALALELVEESARALAVGIAAALQLLNVERVVVAGGVSNAGPILLDRVREHVQKRCFPQVFADASICVAELGSDAGVIGAGTLALLEAGPGA